MKNQIIECLVERCQYNPETFEDDYAICIDNYYLEYGRVADEESTEWLDYCTENWS